MSQTRAAAVAVLVLVAAGGCATDPAAEPGDTPPATEPVKDEVTSKVDEGDVEFGRLLQTVDKRADEALLLTNAPGDEARRRRDLSQSALEAILAQHSDRFLATLGDRSEPTRRRIAAKAYAFSTDRRATPLLAEALREKGDAQLRTNAALALARLRDPDTPTPALLAGARDPDDDVRSNSLLALWHVLDARTEAGRPIDAETRDQALPVLETALFEMGDPMIRAHAAAAMGALGDPRAVDPLLNVLRDKHPGVRTHVSLALGKLGDRRAIRPLVEVIGDSDKGIPRSAVILGISLLLEKEGIAIPPDMPEDERAWRGFVDRSFPADR